MNKILNLFLVMTMVAEACFAGIAKEELCCTSSFLSAKISPNGEWIAQVGADPKGISNVSVYSVKEMAPFWLSSYQTPEIIQFFWSADSKIVLTLKDANGTGSLNLHGFHIESRKEMFYTDQFPKVNAKIVQLSSKENKAVIGLNLRNPHFHDLYILDLDSGEKTLLLENDSFAKFLVSEDLNVILKMRINSDGSWTILDNNDHVWMRLSSEEAFQTEFLSYDSKSDSVYFLDSRFSDMNRLTQKSMESPYLEKILGSGDESDIDETLIIDGSPKAFATYFVKKKWHVMDPSITEDISFLEKEVDPNFEVVSQSLDSSTWIVSSSIPDQGVLFWLYQRDPRRLTLISPQNGRDGLDKMYEMVVTARDGKKLVCYYTLPKAFDKGGFTEKPLPLVAVPHGGPFKVRDRYEFYPFHQWLSGCGYAVLSVNFRLSTGFGKSFVNAGNGEWGGKAHLDVIDAADACIAKGITEKGKMAILGGSYGGFESLAALTFTPDYFTCSVAVCGPSNLKTVLAGVPQFWEFTSKPLSDKTLFFTKRAFVTSMGGDPDDPEGAAYLEKCSPLNHLDGIKAPLLLVHGKNDHVVKESESRQIYESMKKGGKSVTYICFPNEGHRIANAANKLFWLDQAEAFLAKHLKGKHRPVDEELIADTTAEVNKT